MPAGKKSAPSPARFFLAGDPLRSASARRRRSRRAPRSGCAHPIAQATRMHPCAGLRFAQRSMRHAMPHAHAMRRRSRAKDIRDARPRRRAGSSRSRRADARRGARRRPRRPGAGGREKNFFGTFTCRWGGRSARAHRAVAATATRRRRAAASPAQAARCMAKARKAAPQLGFRGFWQALNVSSCGRLDVQTAVSKSVTIGAAGALPDAPGASRRGFGNCLFPLTNLLTRAFDSTSFRVGVTNK